MPQSEWQTDWRSYWQLQTGTQYSLTSEVRPPVLERDGFAFGLASRTPGAARISSSENQQRIGLDGDFGLLRHVVCFPLPVAWQKRDAVCQQGRSRVLEAALKISDNFSQAGNDNKTTNLWRDAQPGVGEVRDRSRARIQPLSARFRRYSAVVPDVPRSSPHYENAVRVRTL